MVDARILLGVLVYDGRDVVPACLASAAKLAAADPGVDVAVFDDCSPSPGWSEDVAGLCAELGIGYYRAPRNIGIPRNMNLVLGYGVEAGYELVGLVNSDVVLPANLGRAVRAAFDDDPTLASLTPWSNNVSAFSLPLDEAETDLRDQRIVDLLADGLAEIHGGANLHVPTGVGYCMVMPRRALLDVGLMDPIFGRGYCEEVDWCQRALRAGYSHGLGLGSFVFHHGSASTRQAGLLAHGHSTVPAHEAIVALRYPDYHRRVREFLGGAALVDAIDATMPRLATALCRRSGYELRVADALAVGGGEMVVTLDPRHPGAPARIQLFGIPIGLQDRPWDVPTVLRTFGAPTRVVVADRGLVAAEVERHFIGGEIELHTVVGYPTRV